MMAEEQNDTPIEDQGVESKMVDMANALEVLKKLEEKGNDEISYGSLAFWISIVKKCERIPDGISMADFHSFLCQNAQKFATVAVREEIKGGENDAGNN